MLHILLLVAILWLTAWLIWRFLFPLFVAFVICAAVFGLCVGMTGCMVQVPPPQQDVHISAFQVWSDGCVAGTIHWEAVHDNSDQLRQGFMAECLLKDPS